ncbi:hypothetical protein AWB90_24000 [Mycobacterium paraense]|uniref:Aminoglycoside phosphotransferase domain-containing protein n=2 Tax=Mycobacterium paraense TaxID=767916 RepID=A0A1X2A4K5_9MYCO|nr:hypothetical protein AWB90_24000 [Mycobacterium paraense]
MTGTSRPSDRLIDVNDLPIGFIDVALSMPPTELVGETVVVLLRRETGPPAAVLKVARGQLRAAKLRTQRRVLAELAVHHGLDDEWRKLLPRILAFDERTNAAVSVESYRRGTDLADILERRPNRVEELTAAALRAIAPLHRGTATPVVVDNFCLLRGWVVEPLTTLTDVCRRLDPRLVRDMNRLGTVLRQALVGRRIPVGWTHGDYAPANVRVAGLRGSVTGIVDWGGARSGQPAFLDEYTMILTASCRVERTDLGMLVADRLSAGGLSGRERSALRAAHDRPGGDVEDRETIDERIAIVLTWLHHVAHAWRKRQTPPDHHTWWANNVAPVLDAVAGWRDGSDLSGARARPGGAVGAAPMTAPPPVKDAAPAQGDRSDG